MEHSLLDHFARTAYPGQKVVVALRSNRTVVGGLVAYDAHYNLVLRPATEVWRAGGEVVSREHRSLYIRGDNVVTVSRPPREEQGV